ncbi:MAG TPA: CHAT domain-containing protein, partial [Cyclobacteriaceae bacterium]|nr:CHAT domain-containing protein [Cyclobacteriaceae bacterium]
CNRLAMGYYLQHDYASAARYYQKAIIANVHNFENTNFDSFPENPDFLDYYELIIAYTAKTDLYTQRGDRASLLLGIKQLDATDKILLEKAQHLSNAKDRLELAEVNSFFTESGLLLTHKLYTVSRDQAHLEKAFYYSDRSKANELFADIKMSRAGAVGRVPKKIVSRQTEITRRMNTLHQQVASAYDAQNQPLITKLKAEEFDLTKELNALETEMAAYSPAYSALSNPRSLPPWSEVKKSLDAKTAIVSYTLTDSAKYILIGNSSKLILKEIPPKTDLDKMVRGYVNQIKFQGPGVRAAAIQLTEILWTPVEAALTEFGGIENVIIIPDGPLNYLPFESLGKDHYLIEKYTIHYQLSGALLSNTAQNKTKNKPSFIALAPVFADKETNFVNKSCERFVKMAHKADTTSRAFSLTGDYIAPLPATETEVEQINQIHIDKGIFTKYFTREAAREELIKKGELNDFDYIHFATHGFVNAQYPELSGLLLTQDANSAEDGILYTGEILGLNLKADLVTLSACETALGKKVAGEGVRGLTTAFLFAGAKSVVASLWKVADESTSILMIAFYTELLSGKDKASALRAAKLTLINGGKYYHPFYWAPFVQIGGN